MQLSKIPARLLLASVALAPFAAAQPLSLTTLFNWNNGGASGWMNLFDINVTNTNGVRIVAFDINNGGTVSVPFSLDIYITPSTYVGKELNAAAWTKVATGNGITQGLNLPSACDTSDFFLAPGSYGIGIYYNGAANYYTNGTGSNQMYSNADIALNLGVAVSGLFTGSIFTPRVWNGTIYYATPVNATYGTLGAGCKGTNGVPSLAPASGSLPKIGTTLTLNMSNLPTAPGAAAMLIGFDKVSWLSNPLPFDLTVIGMTGCSLQIDFVFSLGFVNSGGSGTFSLPIPNNSAFLGAALLNQAFVFDTGANPLGATLSNAGEGQIGM